MTTISTMLSVALSLLNDCPMLFDDEFFKNKIFSFK